MTNFQRIRNMSKEEIGRYLMDPERIDIPFCKNQPKCIEKLDAMDDEIPEEECFRCMMAWLKKEEL